MQYINRISALDDEKIYALNGEGIVSVDDTLLYDDVKSVNLRYRPTKYYGGIYHCEIETDNKKLVLSNRKYVKLATFEYQSDQYKAFIHALHQKLDSSRVKFKSGMSAVRFWLELPFSALFFSAILAALLFFGGWIVFGLFAFVIAVRLIPYYIKNAPRSYMPDKIPLSSLPK